MQSEKSNLVILNGIMRWRLWELLGTACIFVLAPLIAITLTLLYIYRRSVEIVLRIQLRDKFAGLLKGTDCVWAIEDAVSPSIITALLILEKTAQDLNTNFLESFRILINERIISKAAGTTLEKMTYLRSQKFGYYFWERSEKVDLKDRIRWLECATASCDGSCEDISSESFRKNLESVCNKPLPNDHQAAWEILVRRRCPRSRFHEKDHLCPDESFNTDTRKIPVLIRIHHSLGDGEAIIGLLFKAIIEEDEMKTTKTKIKGITTLGETEECFKSLKQQVKMSTDNTWLHYKVIALKQLYGRIKEITRLTMALLSFPKYFIQQAVRSLDENALHNPPVTGAKIMFYWLDNVTNDKSLNLLMKIREIKKHTGSKFEDVVLAAISASVHKYHLRIKKTAPDALTALFPVKMAVPGKNLTLDNNFSVAVLRICISNANGQTIVEPNRDSQFFKRLQDITRANNELRKRSDILLNYWIIKYLSALLPAKMFMQASRLLSDGTMGFSNMRGPEKVHILNNSLSNVVFWIPIRNPVALGISLLSYGGNLQMSLIADKSIVKDETSFKELLENTVHEIETAYNHVVLMRLKPSDLPIETPAKKDIGLFRKKEI